MATDLKERITQANHEAVKRIIAADPVLVDVAPAAEVVPGLEERMILHSGPPISWDEMCGAQQGACIGMAIFEGWAKSITEAERLLSRGEICLEPNHHHQAVGPMAGTITSSMWVFVVENRTFGNRAFCRQVEGRQQFGDYSEDALQTLQQWRDTWAPSIRAALTEMGGLALKPLIIQALMMGDELHNRPNAASSLFANAMTVPMIRAGVTHDALVSTLSMLANHPLFFLGLSMAAAKSNLDPVRGIKYCSVVTAMSRNGAEFGIQVSATGDEWFTAQAPEVDGLYLPGYKPEVAGLDMGDSAITETTGWGGFVLGGAPGILSLVGGTPAEAMDYTRDMRRITTATSPDYLMPVLGFEGTSLGIDIRKVVKTGILPIIDTAMAHKQMGHPIIGAGLVRPPMECFEKALRRFGLIVA
jgi:hypothetical protein